jgi:hypothetical protein
MTDLLDVGVSNEDVLDVQDRLRFLHLYDGAIDGTFTSTLGAAVSAFQQHVNLDATGTLDTDGLHYLRQYSDHHGYGHQRREHHSSGHSSGHAGEHGPQPGVPADQLWEFVDGVNHDSLHFFGAEATVDGDAHAFRSTVIQTVINVQHHALAMVSLSDQAFARACERFHGYVNSQVALQENGPDGLSGHVAMQVARGICDAVGIYLCAFAWPEVKWMFEQVSMGVSHSMSKTSYSAFVGQNSSEYKRFYESRMMELALQVGTWRHQFEVALNRVIDPLLADLNSG